MPGRQSPLQNRSVLWQGKIYENAEKYSVLRAVKAIERSQIVLLVLDGTKDVEEQDKRIAGLPLEQKKAVIIVVNKWDAVKKDEKSMNEYTEKIRSHFVFLNYAPICFVHAAISMPAVILFQCLFPASVFLHHAAFSLDSFSSP